jgi:uncharacterized protein YPO0396
MAKLTSLNDQARELDKKQEKLRAIQNIMIAKKASSTTQNLISPSTRDVFSQQANRVVSKQNFSSTSMGLMKFMSSMMVATPAASTH